MRNNEYDDIPVVYCKQCLSLDNSVSVDMDGKKVHYCRHCGCSETGKALIERWDEMFEQRYNLGPYLKLKMTWDEILEHDNKDVCFDVSTFNMSKKNKKI